MNFLPKWIRKQGKSIRNAKSTTSTSAQDTANNSESLTIDREIIKNTPFTIVGSNKDGYWLTMGKHRISQAYKTKKEVLKYLKRSDWTLVTSVMIAFIHDRKLIDNAYNEKQNGKLPKGESINQL